MGSERAAESASNAGGPLYARIAANLREEILNGVLEPGQRLQEQVLAERYGVSRVPVRDALRRLEVERLIHVEANRGAVVTRVTAEEAAELLRVRMVLEELLSREAAKNRTDEQVDQLRSVVAEGTAAIRGARPAELVALNSKFHRLLGEASHNRTAADLVEQLRVRGEIEYAGRLSRRAETSWEEHRLICEAVVSGDGDEAAGLVRRHIQSATQEWEMGASA